MRLVIQENGFIEKTILSNDSNVDLVITSGTHVKMILSYSNIELYSNIEVQENASFMLLMKHDDDDAVSSLSQTIKVYKNADVKIAYWEIAKGSMKVESHIELMEEGGNATIMSASIASDKQYSITCTHHHPYTTGIMKNYAVVYDQGKYRMVATGKIEKGSHDSISHQSTRVLTMSENHHSYVEPVLLIDENDVKASHAMTLGQLDANQLYYLQSRGLTRQQALGLLTLGYLLPITKLLQDEKIELSLREEIEKKVGLHV